MVSRPTEEENLRNPQAKAPARPPGTQPLLDEKSTGLGEELLARLLPDRTPGCSSFCRILGKS